MKELSIEDKAERYDEAIKRAKSKIKNDKNHVLYEDDVIEIFPELAESDDERIRKELISLFQDCIDGVNHRYTGSDSRRWIAWLEKQGKKQPIIVWHSINEEPEEMKELFCEWESDDATWHDVAFYHADSKTFWNGKRQVENVTRWCYIDDLFERQGENTLIEEIKRRKELLISEKEKETSLNTKLSLGGRIAMLEELLVFANEKQGEQKPADKVEPKFNFSVGQWIVATGKCVYLITKIDGFNVTLVDVDGNEYVFDTSSLEDAHLWTIQDAKDGDVLATKKGNLFIYDKNRYDNGLAYYYVGLVNKELTIKGPHNMLGHFGELHSVFPATKEQRDTLEKAMADAGWEFDFGKKELKKTEQKSATMSLDEAIKHCNEKSCGNNACALEHKQLKMWLTELKELKEKKSAWSEEDELSCFESALFTAFSDAWQQYLRGKEVDIAQWAKEHSKELLEAAKEELKGHNSAWSEEDEAHIMAIDLAVNRCLGKWDCCGEKCPISEHNPWLKSLKDRVQPKQEWSEEDKNFMYDTLSNLTELKDRYGDGYGNVGKCIDWLKSLKARVQGKED